MATATRAGKAPADAHHPGASPRISLDPLSLAYLQSLQKAARLGRVFSLSGFCRERGVRPREVGVQAARLQDLGLLRLHPGAKAELLPAAIPYIEVQTS